MLVPVPASARSPSLVGTIDEIGWACLPELQGRAAKVGIGRRAGEIIAFAEWRELRNDGLVQFRSIGAGHLGVARVLTIAHALIREGLA